MKNQFVNIGRKFYSAIFLVSLLLSPVMVHGASIWTAMWDLIMGKDSSSGPTIGSILTQITSTILAPLIGLLFTAAIVVFFFGVVKYIHSLGDKEKVEGRWLMVWGIIALFVMVSVWGLVKVLTNTFNLDNAPVKSIELIS